MKLWGREYHLLVVTAGTACYSGTTYSEDRIRYICWSGYLYGYKKIVNFTQEDLAGTYALKNKSIHYDQCLVVEVTRRLFLTSYKVLGPVSTFYKFLPKGEQEVCRSVWERKTENETNAN